MKGKEAGHRGVISALCRLRLEDQKFEVSLDCIGRFCLNPPHQKKIKIKIGNAG
jgi:hypothetical protein